MSRGGSGEANTAGAAAALATSLASADNDSADDVSLAESEPDDSPDLFEQSMDTAARAAAAFPPARGTVVLLMRSSSQHCLATTHRKT